MLAGLPNGLRRRCPLRQPLLMLLLPFYAACTFAATGCVESSTPLDAPPVTQDANVSWLLVNPANASIAPGDSLAFVATAEDQSGARLSNVALQWTLTNSAVAKVDAHGVVTGIAPGTAVLQATAGNVTTLATVNIGATSSPAANVWVSISPASQDLIVGQSFQLASVVRDVNGNPVTGVPVSFSSSDASVALVSAGGLVTGKKLGEAVITAVAGTSRATAAADVLASQAAKVSLTPTSMVLQTRQSRTFSAKAVDSIGNPINIANSVDWESSNPSVATVDDSGNVMALAQGSTSVSAAIGSVRTSGTVTVQAPAPASITLTPSSLDVTLGSTLKIVAVVRDSSAAPITGAIVTWSSGNTSVATVDTAGRVTGKSVGIASIRAQSGNVSSFAAVTVLTTPTGTVVVTPGSVTVNLGATANFSATVRDPSGQILTGRAISWLSSQPFVATIDSNGVATALGPGSTTITASSGGINGSATLTVPGGSSQVDLSRQPANMTPLTDRPFNTQATSLSDVADAEGWASSESKYLSTFSITSDPSAPRSPSSVAQLVYPAGMPRDPNLSYSPVTAWIPTPAGTHRVYVSIWLKISSNWRGHNSQANKLMEVFIANHPHCVLGLVGSGNAPLRPSIAINGGPDSREGEYLPSNVAPSVTFSRGDWHRLEMVITANTPGVGDGEATWWMDGQLLGDYRNVMWVGAAEANHWIQLELQPIWGGRNDQLVVTQYLWVDHIYASTSTN